ncbi:structural protein [Lactobacillus phage 521B]|uniref:Structural protein n=2 Tax=Tybeckvirus TaxID=2843105 RepID=A0A4Y5FEK0_9CAUD|nr:structural protein [Lactobacillus phage 521B]YP_009844276.1 structural protein [Lactobacillus phage SAC12B]QBJ03472.1 structural protein [Lactobacillus phage 521B]QBJ03910.1 structural protein [Lactobacillus phage SAC12B]
MPKINVFKKNGSLIQTVDVSDASKGFDITGLGYNTEYQANDIFLQWVSDDGRTSNKVPLPSGFVTGEESATVAPTTVTPTTVAPTTTINPSK